MNRKFIKNNSKNPYKIQIIKLKFQVIIKNNIRYLNYGTQVILYKKIYAPNIFYAYFYYRYYNYTIKIQKVIISRINFLKIK